MHNQGDSKTDIDKILTELESYCPLVFIDIGIQLPFLISPQAVLPLGHGSNPRPHLFAPRICFVITQLQCGLGLTLPAHLCIVTLPDEGLQLVNSPYIIHSSKQVLTSDNLAVTVGSISMQD